MKQLFHPPRDAMSLPLLFQALADPTRLEIVRRLADAEYLTCAQLNGSRPKSSMSHHYKILRDSGLLRTDIAGKEHHNSLRKADVQAVCPGLLEMITR